MSQVEQAVETLKQAGWQWSGGGLRPTWQAQELAREMTRELVNHPVADWQWSEKSRSYQTR